MQLNGENSLVPEDSEVLPSEASEISKTMEEVEKKQSSSSANDPVVENSHKRAALPVHKDPEDTHTTLSSSHSVSTSLFSKSCTWIGRASDIISECPMDNICCHSASPEIPSLLKYHQHLFIYKLLILF